MVNLFLDLYNNSRKIDELPFSHDKDYQSFALKKGYPIGLITPQEHVQFFPVSSPYYKFLISVQGCWIIPLELPNEKIIGFVLKAYNEKQYRVVLEQDWLMPLFGLAGFWDFRYGQTVILAEGVRDALYLQSHYPYVLALLSANPSQDVSTFLRALTDKFILAFDADDAGEKAVKKITADFSKHGKICTRLRPLQKDFGDYITQKQALDGMFINELNSMLQMLG